MSPNIVPKIDSFTLTFKGTEKPRNREARLDFYDFVDHTERDIRCNEGLRYIRHFKTFGTEESYFQVPASKEDYSVCSDPFIRVQNGSTAVFLNPSSPTPILSHFTGPPCIRMSQKASQEFFKRFSDLIENNVPLKYIYLSRLDIKFSKLETITSSNNVKQILTQNSQNVNSSQTPSDDESDADDEKHTNVKESKGGTTYNFGQRSKDKHYGRVVIRKSKKKETIYFELEIKDKDIQMNKDDLWLKCKADNEKPLIETFLKDSLPFFHNNPNLLHPDLKIGSSVTDAVSKEKNFNSETFFNPQISFEKRGLKSIYKPLWTFFTFFNERQLYGDTGGFKPQEWLFQLKFFTVLNTAVKNLYFQTLSTKISFQNLDPNVNENIFNNTFLHIFNEKPFILEMPLDLLEEDLIYKKSRENCSTLKKALFKIQKFEPFILDMEVRQTNLKNRAVNKVKTENRTPYRPFSSQETDVKGDKLCLTLNLAFLSQNQVQNPNLGLFPPLFYYLNYPIKFENTKITLKSLKSAVKRFYFFVESKERFERGLSIFDLYKKSDVKMTLNSCVKAFLESYKLICENPNSIGLRFGCFRTFKESLKKNQISQKKWRRYCEDLTKLKYESLPTESQKRRFLLSKTHVRELKTRRQKAPN